MTLGGWILLALLVGAVSFGFALCVTIIIHSIRWLFKLGQATAKFNPWN
jgi:hypothetical protein